MKLQASFFSFGALFKLAYSLVSVSPYILIEGATTEVEFTFNSTQNGDIFSVVLLFPNHKFISEGRKYAIKPHKGWQIEEVFRSDTNTSTKPKVIHTNNKVNHESFKVEVSVPLHYSGSVEFHAFYHKEGIEWSSPDIKSPNIEIPVISQKQLLYDHQLVSGLKETVANVSSIKKVPSGLVPVITQSDLLNNLGSHPGYGDDYSTPIPFNGTGFGLGSPQSNKNPGHPSVVVVVMVQNIHVNHNSAILNFVNANQTLSNIIEESNNLNVDDTTTGRR